jgi:2-keto-4-pentenoate hydratase/2-oxohepta-3-ene-1,7-dioic acid hydratase in catechol pathway
MKLVTYCDTDGPRVGLLTEDRILDVPGLLGPEAGDPQETVPAWTRDMVSFIERGPAATEALWIRFQCWREEVAQAAVNHVDLGDTRLLAPIPRARKNIFCVGLNYAVHAREGAAAVGRSPDPPEHPTFFTKPPTAVIGPGEAILWDMNVTQELDFEVELAIIIGKKGTNIPVDDAMDFVFGYTIINDVSARDLQRRHKQWFKGKSLDTTCPLGPCIVTKGDIPDPQDLEISLRLNGVTMQSSNTKHMVFSVAELIHHLSRGMTLEPGDIVATGTPAGVGFARQPPVFLREGDVVEAEVERIGILVNTVQLA